MTRERMGGLVEGVREGLFRVGKGSQKRWSEVVNCGQSWDIEPCR
jgi:hypothetical protein